jgi:hypothetical protein
VMVECMIFLGPDCRAVAAAEFHCEGNGGA